MTVTNTTVTNTAKTMKIMIVTLRNNINITVLNTNQKVKLKQMLTNKS